MAKPRTWRIEAECGALDHVGRRGSRCWKRRQRRRTRSCRSRRGVRGPTTARFTARDVLARYDDLLAHGAWSSGLGCVATSEELASGVYGFLCIRDQWPELGRALAAASADAAQLTSAAQFFSPSYGMYRAIGCQDFPSPFTGIADLRATAAVVKTVAPHSWRYSGWWNFASGCAGWPLPARNPPHPDRVHGTPPILVVGGAHDPATPLAWARGLAADVDGSVLLTRLDDGHTGLLNSACARAAETKYLVSGLTPPRGTICR